MTEVIVFPDAAKLAIDYLRAQLVARGETTVKVGSRIPSPNDHDLIRVFRTGGPSSFFVIDQAQLTVEAYGPNDARAHDLAQLARGLLHAMAGTTQSGVAIYTVNEFSGPQELPDPVTNKPRYTFSIQVSVRGAAA